MTTTAKPKTTFANGINPFMPKSAPKKEANSTEFNPMTLEIRSDKYSAKHIYAPSKYAELFSKLKPGQCVRVQTEHVNKTADAARTWCKNGKNNLVARATFKYPGDKGFGRVWILQNPGDKND